MGSSNFDKWTGDWVKKNYPDSKNDLCTCFIERGFTLAVSGGYNTMVTMQSWMFLGSYEKMREKLLANESIISMCHLGARAFDAIGGEVVATVATVFENGNSDAKGSYIRLVDIIGSEPKREAALEAIQNPACGWFYRADAATFKDIPGTPIAYWASEGLRAAFAFDNIASTAHVGIGMRTGDNERFLRLWFEVSQNRMQIGCTSRAEQVASHRRWIPYNKGGLFRRWYGNNEYVVNWENDGAEIKDNTRRVYPDLGDNLSWKISNEDYYYRPGLTWTGVTSGLFNCRLYGVGFIFDSGANGLFATDKVNVEFYAGLLNSSVAASAFSILNPTLNYGSGTVGSIPVIEPPYLVGQLIGKHVASCTRLSAVDYDSFEASWDFKRHPLV